MSKRPNRTTMEGMIWNANHVLDHALSPKTNGVPRKLFAKCKGIVLISIVEAGFILSGNVGTGVVMARSDEGVWSPPSALGLVGVGFGFIAGAEIKDAVILIMDEVTMDAFCSGAQVKLGAQASITLDTLGREGDVALDADLSGTNSAIGGTVAFAFTNGLFGGVSLEGAILGKRDGANIKFYGKNPTVRQILVDGVVEIPKESGVPDLHRKLNLLVEGKTSEPTVEEVAKPGKLFAEAEKAGEVAKDENEDIEFVDAKAEAEKETNAVAG